MKTKTSVLVDSKTKKPLKLKKIHGNKKIRNPITGQENWMTMADFRRAGREAAENLIKNFDKAWSC